MTVVNPKSISGINSITTGSGSDNLLTIHTSDASSTERVRINSSGDVIVGSGITVSPDGDIFATGVTTSTTFVGALTGNVTGNISGGTVAGSTGTFTDDLQIAGDLIHINDTNTRIKFPSNDTITAETGGAERLRINSSGAIYLGTSSWPTSSFGASAGRVIVGNEGSLTVWNETNSAGGGGTLKLACKEGSNAARVGFVNLVGGTENTSDRSSFFKIQVSNSSGSGIERLRIQSDGEVFIGDGLGSTNRSTLLSISGAYQEATGAWAQMGLYSSDSYAQNKGGSLVFGGQDGSVARQYFAGIAGVKENTTSGNYAGVMKFYIRPAGSTPVERLRITSNGDLKFNSGYGSVNTAYGIRAWIAFKAAGGSNTVRGSGNATMTDHGTGDFTMNFTTAMPDAAYCVVGSAGYNSGVIVLGLTGSGTHSSPQTSGFRFTIRANYNNSSLMDEEYINLMVVR